MASAPDTKDCPKDDEIRHVAARISCNLFVIQSPRMNRLPYGLDAVQAALQTASVKALALRSPNRALAERASTTTFLWVDVASLPLFRQ